jgi:hypothetical protein
MRKVAILTSLIFFVLTNLNGQIPIDNLIGFWSFNSNANDLSINNNHGTVSGATLVSDRFGNINSAYHFDGNDYISIPHSTTLNMQDSISFSVWLKPEILTGTRMIFGKSNYSTQTNYLLRVKPSGYIQWEYNGYTETDSVPLQLNTWHHIVVTASDPTQIKKIYIDNQLVKEIIATSGAFGQVTNPFTIGYASYGSEYFIGAIDDIRMYNSVLSEIEIDALFNESCNSINSIAETACDSYTAPDGEIYTTSGIKTAVIPNASGCDSTITINLTVNQSSTNSITETACDSYTAPDGEIYTTSGIKTAVIPNVAGCDSTITINLIVNQSSASSITETACDNYTAPDGVIYTTSGIKSAIIPNAAGCDSTITINLTINTVNVSVTQNGIILSANATVDFYQWLDCNNGNSIISGETFQSFTATQNGSYAVKVSQNGCTDTSACYSVTTVGILENTFGHDITVYPNPTYGIVTIDLGENLSEFIVSLNNVNGKLISQSTYKNTKMFDLNLNVQSGIYLLTINSENKKATIRLIKN